MGQLRVAGLPASALRTTVTALAERGVAVERDARADRAPDQVVDRCRRRAVGVAFVTCPDDTKPGGLFVLMPYFQHSLRPWRWLKEWRL